MIRIQKKELFLFFLFTLLTYVLSFSGSLKYAAVLAVAALYFIRFSKISMEDFRVFVPFLLYMALGAVPMLITRETSFTTAFKMLCFFVVPFICAVAQKNFCGSLGTRKCVYLTFFAILFVWCVIQRLEGESQYAFVLGAFGLYFLSDDRLSFRVKTFLIVICTVLEVFFGEKRLAVAAFFFCAVIQLVGTRLLARKKKALLKRVILTGWILVVCVLFLYVAFCRADGALILRDQYGITVSGRENAWRVFHQYYDVNPGYMGRGFGWVYTKLDQLQLPNFLNLHNDILMTYIDLGFVGFGIWIASFYYVIRLAKEERQRLCVTCVLLYTVINYMTDNIMIYVNYWMPVYLILFDLIRPVSAPKEQISCQTCADTL